MKTTKPLRLSVLVRPYELARKVHAVITLFAPFRLDEPQHLLTDMEMWPAAAKALGEGGVLDDGLVKVSGEVFVAGSCHPQNPPQAVSYVCVTLVGEDGEPKVKKRIAVIGDREWKLGVPTAPQPFSSMPIRWDRAFGGSEFARNPLGRGVKEKNGDGKATPLPNLEDPERLICSPSDAPEPRTFLPYDPTWPQRITKMGTQYDEKWLEERYPGPAEDVDPTCYHAGGEDQRLSGYFSGGERFVIENMHPGKHRIEGHLPRLVGRAFITRRPKDLKMPRRGRPAPTKLEEVRTRIDTVWLFPEEQIGVLIFRGTTPASDDDLADIEHLLIAADDPREPRSLSHFERTLLERLDPDTGVIRLLDDEDLLPPERLGWKVSFPELEIEQHTAPVGYLKANLAANGKKLREDAAKTVLALGLDLKEYGLDEPAVAEPEAPSLREPKKLAVFIREHMERAKAEQAKGEARGAEMRAEAAVIAAEHGIQMDPDRVAGPPALRVRAMLAETIGEGSSGERDLTREELRAVFDETAIGRLEAKEKEAIEAYRKTSHFETPPRLPAEELRAARRMQMELARDIHAGSSIEEPAEPVSLTDVDFSGADLSGLDLSGMNLSGVFLERANLTGCNLRGANLDRAMIAHADLTDANLDDTSLVDANLGSSMLVRTSLRRAMLTNARLDRATIENACFEGATIEQASFIEMTVRGVDFSGTAGNQTIFLRLDLRGAKFQRARLTKTMFVECKLEGASFDDAEMPKTQLVTCSATGLSARGARLRGSFVGHGSTLDRANLDGVDLSSSSLRTTSLVNASLKSAKLSGADLSECDATGANFDRVQADKSMMQRTLLHGANLFGANLREAILSKANLAECDLSHANLFRADLSRIHVSGGTKIDGALLEFARVDPKESNEEKAE